MMMMNNTPSPRHQNATNNLEADPDFISQLEDQLRHAYRRRALFYAEPPQRRSIMFTWRIAAMLAIVCLAGISLGAAGAIAMTNRTGPEFELSRLRAEASVRIAQVALDSAAREVEQIKQLFDAGVASLRTLDDSRIELIEATANLERCASELEEIELRQGVASDSITANTPLNRDFVAERLQIRLNAASFRADILARRHQLAQQLADAGRATHSSTRAALNALLEAQRDAELTASLLDLRARVVADELLHEQAELEAMQLRKRAEVAAADARVTAVSQSIDHLRPLAERAFVSTEELDAAQRELEVLMIERDTLEQQLAIITTMLAEREAPPR